MKIRLKNGRAVVPDAAIVLDKRKGKKAVDIAVIYDSRRQLAPVVVVASRDVTGLSSAEEEQLVNEAVKALPVYKEIKKTEKPFPAKGAAKEEWVQWDESFRLHLFPLSQLSCLSADYQFRQKSECILRRH